MECSSDIKECIECIKSVLPDFQFTPSTDRDFYETLSDGEILCSLLTEISDGRIAYDSSCSHVLASKNIVFFLSQCREAFCLDDSDLFEPDDLLSMSNPENVVRTVLKLASKISLTAIPRSRNSGLMENVIKEICDLEGVLIGKLQVLLVYQSELLSLLSEWDEELVQFVFKHIGQLHTLHKELLARLSSLAEQGCEKFCQKLGALFREMEPKLSVYIPYLCHLRSAHYRMDTEFSRAPELRTQIQLLDRRFEGPGFLSLYDGPIRQTTNYPQLFKRLHRTAQKEIPEVADSLQSLIEYWEEFLIRTNALKKEADGLVDTQLVLDLVKNLPTDLRNPELAGLHLADSLFKVRNASDRKLDAQTCLCLLTAKQLIVAAKPNSSQDSPATFWFNVPILSSLQVVKKSGGSLEIALENGGNVILEQSKAKSKSLEKFKMLLDEARVKNSPNGSHCPRQLDFDYQPKPCRRGRRGSVDPAMTSQQPTTLRVMNFYHKGLKREKAELILRPREVGAFLLRDSSDGGMALSLRVRSDRSVEHINIIAVGRKCALGNGIFLFDSLDALVDYYTEHKLSVHFSGIKCALGSGVVTNNVIRVAPHQRTLIEEM